VGAWANVKEAHLIAFLMMILTSEGGRILTIVLMR
jgi:hypothetical protein